MKNLFYSFVFFSAFTYGQNNDDLKNEIRDIKIAISNLQMDLQSVKSENIYLKKIFDINKPILQKNVIGNIFNVTGVTGNKKSKSITITLLVEAKDENKNHFISQSSLIDLEGNEVNINLDQSVSWQTDLTLNVPKKIILTYNISPQNEEVIEPKLIKLLKISYTYNYNINSSKYIVGDGKEIIEFKDLNVIWK